MSTTMRIYRCAFAALCALSGCKVLDEKVEQETKALEQKIEQQVVDDAVQQYEIAKRSGDKMDACVHAGFVTAAYLQAKDEANFKQWKAIEKKDCRRAGL